MKILGIESSCDETGAAIVQDGKTILSNVVASSAAMHQKYGGIVPEVAARKQLESIIPVLTEAMHGFSKDDIDAIAVTVGPGLIGSLLVGVETAKTLAFAWKKPIIPVNHVLAHMYAVFLENDQPVIPNSVQDPKHDKLPKFPAISLVVSGGHTELYLMKDEKTIKWLGGTLDDAAGECFDKCARLLGLPYPGGPQIAAKAEKHIPHYSSNEVKSLLNSSSHIRSNNIRLPRPMIDDESLNFSFSGLKTAVLREFNKLSDDQKHDSLIIAQFSHEIQESITDVLVAKTLKATTEHNVNSIIISGGVAANKRLSHKLSRSLPSGVSLRIPPPLLCVDSASYIAAYAFYHQKPIDWKQITATPHLSVEV